MAIYSQFVLIRHLSIKSSSNALNKRPVISLPMVQFLKQDSPTKSVLYQKKSDTKVSLGKLTLALY